MTKKQSIFVSYRREDSAGSARTLYERIKSRFPNILVFFDVESIEHGDNFIDRINQEISHCDLLLIIVGRYWLSHNGEAGQQRLFNADDLVRQEIKMALNRKIRVLPVLVDNAKQFGAEDLPADIGAIAHIQSIPVSHSSFNQDADKLLNRIQKLLEQSKAEHENQPIQPLKGESNNDTASKKQSGGSALLWVVVAVVYLFCTILLGGIISSVIEIVVSLIWDSKVVADGTSVGMLIFFASMIAAFLLLLKPAGKILADD